MNEWWQVKNVLIYVDIMMLIITLT